MVSSDSWINTESVYKYSTHPVPRVPDHLWLLCGGAAGIVPCYTGWCCGAVKVSSYIVSPGMRRDVESNAPGSLLLPARSAV
jgi:hypothetical protein